MKKLGLIFFLILFGFISFGQKTENEIFEESKGKWEVHLKKYNRIISDVEKRKSCVPFIDLALSIVTDSSYNVISINDGRVEHIIEIDTVTKEKVVIIRYGDYYTSYYPLKDIIVNKGYFLKKGEVFAVLCKNFDEYILDVRLCKGKKDIYPENWINWKPTPSKKKKTDYQLD